MHRRSLLCCLASRLLPGAHTPARATAVCAPPAPQDRSLFAFGAAFVMDLTVLLAEGATSRLDAIILPAYIKVMTPEAPNHL